MKIEWFRSETESILHSLAEYQAVMETQLDTVQTNEQKRVRDWLRSIEFESDDWDVESSIARDEYEWTYNIMFPKSLRYSFLVLLFLVLERQLIGLCDDIKDRQKLPIRANDLKGDTILRCKIYLQKLAGISRVDDQLWVKVEDLSKVRNCIVHALGKIELSNDQRRLQELATNGHGISISGHESPEEGLLIITSEYCQQAINDVLEFFTAIFEAAGYGPSISI
jgi:hypothetical protein